jgi:O-antigen/teichoic acid export membrane protein
MNKRSVFRVIAAGSVVNSLISGLQILGSLMTARILGPEGRGQLAAVQLWPSYLVAFGALGITNATAYYSGRNPEKAASTFATAWLMLMTLAVPLMVAGYWAIPFLLGRQGGSTISIARVLLFLVPIQFGGNLPFFALQGLGRFKTWNLVRLQFAVLWVLVQAVAWWARFGTVSFLAYGYLVVVAINCTTWMVAEFISVAGPYIPDFKLVRSLLSYGLPTAAASAPQQLNLRLDQGLMAVFLPATTLGLYSVAVAVGGVGSPFLTAISQAVLPYLARRGDQSDQALTAVRLLRVSAVVAVAITLVFVILTPLALPLAFGERFRPAVPAAVILVVAGCFGGLNSICAEAFKGIGLPRPPLIAESVGAICTVVVLPALLWRYGIVGAAVASMASYTATYCAYMRLLSVRTGLRFRECALPSQAEFRLLTNLLPQRQPAGAPLT